MPVPACECCGTGTLGPPVVLPGDPSNSALITATRVYGGIYVAWDYPAVNPHGVAFMRLYRSTVNNFESALLYRTLNADHYYDEITVSVPTTYYYWLKITSINGTEFTVVGPASAEALPRVSDMLALLTGQINSGVLATALQDKILTIDQLGLDLTLEAQNRQDADDALSVLVSAVQTENADILAMIIDEQSVRATADSALTTSINAAYAAIDDVQALVLVETEARVDGDAALASQITTVQTEAADNLAAVQVSLETWIGGVEDTVDEIGALYTVQVTVNGLVGGFGIYNSGTSIQAGFDVDTFWVGTTAANKVKPFIISGGTVYMQNIVVQDALIESLSAGKITTGNLEVLIGTTGTAGIRGGKTSFTDTTNAGFILGMHAGVPKLFFGNAGNSKSISWNGSDLIINGDIIASGNLKVNSVTTQKIVNNSVTGVYYSRNSTTFSTAGSYAWTTAVEITGVVVPDVDGTGLTAIPILLNWSALTSGDNSDAPSAKWRIQRTRTSVGGTASGTAFEQELPGGWKDSSWAYSVVDNVLPGTYTYTLQCGSSSVRSVYDAGLQLMSINK